MRATVELVRAASGVWQEAATPTSIGRFSAAGLIARAGVAGIAAIQIAAHHGISRWLQ
jgi:hypothetical protein